MYLSRVRTQSGRNTSFIIVAGLLVLGITLGGGVAKAQMSPGETVIGTFELRGGDRGSASEAEVGQARLFQRAQNLLRSGSLSAAQRNLEQVIALGPETALAAHARRQLGGLYRAEPPGAPDAMVEPAVDSGLEPSLQPPTAPLRKLVAAGRKAPLAGSMHLGGSVGTVAAAPRIMEMSFIEQAGDRVFFSNGSAELGSRGRAAVLAQATWLKANPEVEARVEGHADDPPLRPEAQEELSEARAASVRDALIAAGVEPDRLGIVPWGRERRVAECAGPDCEAQNQRAVTVLAVPAGPGRPELSGQRSPSAPAFRDPER